MKLRPLGKTGILTSEIALGGWQLANPLWGKTDEKEAMAVIYAALEAGCNLFDTAPGYSEGRSETLLGHGLGGMRASVVICTKFGHDANGENDFSCAALRPSLEASLKRLRTDYVDLLLVHSPPQELMDGNGTPLYEELQQLKIAGKIRAYGVSVDSGRDLEKVIQTTRSEVAEVLFNVFHQEPLAAFHHAEAQGVGLIVKMPLDSGWLSGKYSASSRFDGVRERWSSSTIRRRAALVEQLSALVPADRSMTHTALQYILAQPQVSTVIPGAKTVDQVLHNVAAADAELPAETIGRIRVLWESELKANPLPW